MNEKWKLEEAKYFYLKMIQEQENYKYFTFNLSAFLASARSVLQYTKDEAKRKNKGQCWYDTYIVNSTIFKYFKDKRDFSIHKEPVKPSKSVTVKVPLLHIQISEPITVNPKEKVNNKKHLQLIDNYDKEKTEYKGLVTSENEYKFDDCEGEEDVLKLCELYILELEEMIKDGISRDFIAV